MKRNKKFVWRVTMKIGRLILIAAIILIGLAACTQKSAEPSVTHQSLEKTNDQRITLRVGFEGDGSDIGKVKEIFAKYEVENPQIKIQPIFILSSDWNEYISKVQAMIASNTSPDLLYVTNETTPVFEHQGFLEPLDTYMKSHPDWFGDVLQDVHPASQEPFMINGRTFGLARDFDNVVMHINTKFLQEAGLSLPPESWSQEIFLEFCKKLTKINADGTKRFGFQIPIGYFTTTAWIYSAGGKLFNDEMTKSTINSKEVVDLIKFWQDLIYKYKYAPIPQPEDDDTRAIMNGMAAMISAGKWPTSNYVERDFRTVAVQYLPRIKTDQVLVGSGGISVLQPSKHKEEAVKLAAWTADKYYIERFYKAGHIPARKSLMEDMVGNAGIPDNYKLFWESADKGVPIEITPSYSEVATVFLRVIREVLSSPDDPQPALDKAVKEINLILQKDQK
jgi:multiple sugar transport system substrate-binding protein